MYKLYSSLPDINYEKCLNIIKSLVRNEPKNVQYLEIMANLQDKTGHSFDAIKTYKQILRIDPNNSEIKKKLNNISKKTLGLEKEKIKSSSSYNEDDDDWWIDGKYNSKNINILIIIYNLFYSLI